MHLQLYKKFCLHFSKRIVLIAYKHEIINKSKLDVNSSCALLAELYVNLLSVQVLVSANLQIVLIGYWKNNLSAISLAIIMT